MVEGTEVSVDNVVILVPTFNEKERINQVIFDLKRYFKTIVVVDDGSQDSVINPTIDNLYVLRHEFNLGQGAALNTGIKFIKYNEDIKYIVTFDADGQHSAKDAFDMVKTIKENNVNVIVGSRFLRNSKQIPFIRRNFLKIIVNFNRTFLGVRFTDTHNGLRVMDYKTFSSLEFKQNRMAHASEFIKHIIKNNLKVMEYPTDITYLNSKVKKSQSLFNSVHILRDLFWEKLKNE